MATDLTDIEQLSDLCTPWCVHVVATLRIADHIAAGHTESRTIAEASGVNVQSLVRVLRHLVSKGLFAEPTPGQFVLNEAASALLDERVRLGLDLNGFGGRMAHAWGTLLEAVETGRPAYDHTWGCGFWEDLDSHPEIASSFDTLLGPAGHGVPDPEVLLDPGDWDSVRTVVDVGGGTGSLLAEVLRTRPNVFGTLIDLPRTVARSHKIFEAARVSDRVTVVGQSFFDPLPRGSDVYLMKSVLSDWPDREAALILTRCAEAAGRGGRVVILNGVDPQNPVSPDLLMMVLVGGKDRTLREFTELARGAGLTVLRTSRQPSGRFIVECAATGETLD